MNSKSIIDNYEKLGAIFNIAHHQVGTRRTVCRVHKNGTSMTVFNTRTRPYTVIKHEEELS